MYINKILIVDDDKKVAKLLQDFLSGNGYVAATAFSGEEAMKKYGSEHYELVIADYILQGIDGIGLLKKLKLSYPDVFFILMTGYGTIEAAFEASKLGANFFLKKPFEFTELSFLIGKLETEWSIRNELKSLKSNIPGKNPMDAIIGDSDAVRNIKKKIMEASKHDSPVLITGEKGTGKELAARIMHLVSPRNQGPFIPVNCSVIPEKLMEIEFFGCLKGAYPGISGDKRGVLEDANKGTLFLDDIDHLPKFMQVKLAQSLKAQRIKRLGADHETGIDMKIIAASTKDLSLLMERNLFMEDLFFHINVISIYFPPLRERFEDLQALAQHFIEKSCQRHNRLMMKLSDEALFSMQKYPFPGNIRQLENLMERSVILAKGSVINDLFFDQDPDLDPELMVIFNPNSVLLPYKEANSKMRKQFDRQYFLYALKQNGHNTQKTANALGVSLRIFQYKIKQLGLKKYIV
jgi:DNA-binding NtrC family response regulator